MRIPETTTKFSPGDCVRHVLSPSARYVVVQVYLVADGFGLTAEYECRGDIVEEVGGSVRHLLHTQTMLFSECELKATPPPAVAAWMDGIEKVAEATSGK